MKELKIKMTEEFYKRLKDSMLIRHISGNAMGLPDAMAMLILDAIKKKKKVIEFPPKQ